MQLFVDMDGVLADFDTGYELEFGIRPSKADDNVDWDAVRAVPGFYENLPPMPDLAELWHFIQPFEPIVLTGVPSDVPEAPDNKRAWVEKTFGGGVPIICCRSREKSLHAKPGDILIDDWERYRDLWIGVDGRWITHRSASETISELAILLTEK